MKKMYTIILSILVIAATAVILYYVFNKDQQLKRALYKHDWESVKKFIEKGANPNISLNWTTMKQQGHSPLTVAVAEDRIDIVKFLLDHKADPRLVGPFGVESLHYTIATNNPEMVTLLLQHGADPNESNRMNEMPVWVHFAQTGNVDILKLFIEAGANINARAVDGGYWWDGAPQSVIDYMLSLTTQNTEK